MHGKVNFYNNKKQTNSSGLLDCQKFEVFGVLYVFNLIKTNVLESFTFLIQQNLWTLIWYAILNNRNRDYVSKKF